MLRSTCGGEWRRRPRPHEFGGLASRHVLKRMAGGEQRRGQRNGSYRRGLPSINEPIDNGRGHGRRRTHDIRQGDTRLPAPDPPNPTCQRMNLLWEDQANHGHDGFEQPFHVRNPREERGISSVEGLYQQRSVDVTIASLAGSFGHQIARVAGRRVRRAIFARIVLRAQRTGRAYLRSVQRLPEQSPEVFRFAEIDKAAQRPIGVGGGRVNENARLGIRTRQIGVDAFADARCVVAAFQREFADKQARESVEHGMLADLVVPAALAQLVDEDCVGAGEQLRVFALDLAVDAHSQAGGRDGGRPLRAAGRVRRRYAELRP